MNKSQIKLDLLLDLFNAGYKNAYVSSMDLFKDHNSHLTRIEIILQNVGRLCLYQDFTELVDGEQVPSFIVFYSAATDVNIRTKITNQQSLSKAVNIIYKTKKFVESNPTNEIVFEHDLIERTRKNRLLATKLFNKHIKKISPFFQMIYNQK